MANACCGAKALSWPTIEPLETLRLHRPVTALKGDSKAHAPTRAAVRRRRLWRHPPVRSTLIFGSRIADTVLRSRTAWWPTTLHSTGRRDRGMALSARQKPATMTFSETATALIESMSPAWRNAKHRAQWTMTLNVYCAPMAGTPVADITTDDVLRVLKPLWLSKPETGPGSGVVLNAP